MVSIFRYFAGKEFTIILTTIAAAINKESDSLAESVYDTDYDETEDDREEELEESNDEPEEERVWLIREYEERIGIFDENGALLDVIDVYVKTLPIADRSLLEEGFEVVGKQRLYSIIEDYSV